MAAEITIFTNAGSAGGSALQVAKTPVASQTATFTSAFSGVMRVYANAAPVVLTMNTFTLTVPSGTVEYFGITAGQLVTVA